MGLQCTRPSVCNDYKLIVILPLFSERESIKNLKSLLNDRIRNEESSYWMNDPSLRHVLIINKNEDKGDSSAQNLLTAWESMKSNNLFSQLKTSLSILMNSLTYTSLLLSDLEDCFLEINPNNIYIQKDGTVKLYTSHFHDHSLFLPPEVKAEQKLAFQIDREAQDQSQVFSIAFLIFALSSEGIKSQEKLVKFKQDKQEFINMLESSTSLKYIPETYVPIIKAALEFSPKKRPSLELLRFSVSLALQAIISENQEIESHSLVLFRKNSENNDEIASLEQLNSLLEKIPDEVRGKAKIHESLNADETERPSFLFFLHLFELFCRVSRLNIHNPSDRKAKLSTDKEKIFSTEITQKMVNDNSYYTDKTTIRQSLMVEESELKQEMDVFELNEAKTVYLGQWKYGMRHGWGRQLEADGKLYEGFFKKDNFHGFGRMVYGDGLYYEGLWSRGKRSGKGVLLMKGRLVYNGEWLENLQHGWGVEEMSSETLYEGEFYEGKKHGKGKLTWKHGDAYEGQMENNKINGVGVYKWVNGKVYKGQWKNNLMQGKGEFYWPDGKQYLGEFFADKRHGKGTFLYKNGEKLYGEFDNGQLNGPVTITDAFGNVFEQEYRNNQPIPKCSNAD